MRNPFTPNSSAGVTDAGAGLRDTLASGSANRFAIEAGQTLARTAQRVETIQILSGCAWVTVEGVSHDYWLSAGDEFILTPHRLTVIEADREEVQVKSRSMPARDLLQAMRLWLASLLRGQRHTLAGGGVVRGVKAGACSRVVPALGGCVNC